MALIELRPADKAKLVGKIKTYFQTELDQQIETFPAEFLLDFFIEEMGPYFYNQAIADTQAWLGAKMATLADDLYELEKPVK